MERGRKRYEFGNHLGNVLTVISDGWLTRCEGDSVVGYQAQVITATDYSAFGAALPGRMYRSNTAPGGKTYRFGFNGKENLDEGFEGLISFEARSYDARLGRFLSCDPLEIVYAYQSTYVFAHNSPIALIDFLGMGDPPKHGDTRTLSAGDGTPKTCTEYWDENQTVGGQKGAWVDYNPIKTDPMIAFNNPDKESQWHPPLKKRLNVNINDPSFQNGFYNYCISLKQYGLPENHKTNKKNYEAANDPCINANPDPLIGPTNFPCHRVLFNRFICFSSMKFKLDMYEFIDWNKVTCGPYYDIYYEGIAGAFVAAGLSQKVETDLSKLRPGAVCQAWWKNPPNTGHAFMYISHTTTHIKLMDQGGVHFVLINKFKIIYGANFGTPKP